MDFANWDEWRDFTKNLFKENAQDDLSLNKKTVLDSLEAVRFTQGQVDYLKTRMPDQVKNTQEVLGFAKNLSSAAWNTLYEIYGFLSLYKQGWLEELDFNGVAVKALAISETGFENIDMVLCANANLSKPSLLQNVKEQFSSVSANNADTAKIMHSIYNDFIPATKRLLARELNKDEAIIITEVNYYKELFNIDPNDAAFAGTNGIAAIDPFLWREYGENDLDLGQPNL